MFEGRLLPQNDTTRLLAFWRVQLHQASTMCAARLSSKIFHVRAIVSPNPPGICSAAAAASAAACCNARCVHSAWRERRPFVRTNQSTSTSRDSPHWIFANERGVDRKHSQDAVQVDTCTSSSFAHKETCKKKGTKILVRRCSWTRAAPSSPPRPPPFPRRIVDRVGMYS